MVGLVIFLKTKKITISIAHLIFVFFSSFPVLFPWPHFLVLPLRCHLVPSATSGVTQSFCSDNICLQRRRRSILFYVDCYGRHCCESTGLRFAPGQLKRRPFSCSLSCKHSRYTLHRCCDSVFMNQKCSPITGMIVKFPCFLTYGPSPAPISMTLSQHGINALISVLPRSFQMPSVSSKSYSLTGRCWSSRCWVSSFSSIIGTSVSNAALLCFSGTHFQYFRP